MDKELYTKIKHNIWDNINEVFPAIRETLEDIEWIWPFNSKCKYITVRIDMRDGGCILKDRNGNRISIEDLVYQYER